MSNTCYIVGAGDMDGCIIDPKPGDFIIAADGGFTYLEKLKISADLVVGDFDSLGHLPDHPNVVRHKAEKDDTDMMLAVNEGIARRYDSFCICGGLGGRLDHTLGNLQTLIFLARRGKCGFLTGDGMVITAVHGKTLLIGSGRHGIISVFSGGDKASGVSLSGLKYPLKNADLTCDVTLGVSNEFTGVPAEISATGGTLLVMWYEKDFNINNGDVCFRAQ